MLKSIHAPRAVDLAVEALRGAILAGLYPAGARLPAERNLAESMGINRLTLRAALAQLQTEGLVQPRQGDGVRVLDFRASAGVDLISHLMGIEEPGMIRGFLELRRAIAAEAVAMASVRARPKDVDALEALAELQATEVDRAAFVARDLEFARALLRIADNLAMELLLNTTERVYRARPEIADALHHDLNAVRASYFAVVALIRGGDPEVARRTVREALVAIDDKALVRLRRLRGASSTSTKKKKSPRKKDDR